MLWTLRYRSAMYYYYYYYYVVNPCLEFASTHVAESWVSGAFCRRCCCSCRPYRPDLQNLPWAFLLLRLACPLRLPWRCWGASCHPASYPSYPLRAGSGPGYLRPWWSSAKRPHLFMGMHYHPHLFMGMHYCRHLFRESIIIDTCSREWIIIDTCSREWIIVDTCSREWIIIDTCSLEWIIIETCLREWIIIHTCLTEWIIIDTCLRESIISTPV